MPFQGGLERQELVQGTVKSILSATAGAATQQMSHGGAFKPPFMHTQFAAGSTQPIDHQ